MVDYSPLLTRLRRWRNYDKIELSPEDIDFLAEQLTELIGRTEKAERELARLREAGL